MEAPSSEPKADRHSEATWTAECTAAVAAGERLHFDVYRRSAEAAYGTRGFHDRVMERVHELERRGILADYDRHVWGDRLRIGSDATGIDAHATALADLRIWARERGATLPFEVRECTSTVLEQDYVVLVPPHLLLAVRADDRLVGVAPCRHGSESTSVMGLLALLCDRERGEEHRTSVPR